MNRFILTGTPGAGKTSILQRLHDLGYATVGEAATAVITHEQARGRPEPWNRDDFIDKIIALQQHRQTHTPASEAGIQFHDRSPVCTHALSVYQGREPTPALHAELERIAGQRIYKRQVFFICNLGFCEPTAARRISFEQSLVFERIHRDSYKSHGYQLIDIPAGPVDDRVSAIIEAVSRLKVHQ